MSEKKEKMKREACTYSGIGGQAVMEGVMMKNGDDYAVAVRKQNGEIIIKKDVYAGIIKNKALYKIPIIRGVLSFIDSLVLGMSTLNFSSDIYMEEPEEEGTEKPAAEAVSTAGTVAVETSAEAVSTAGTVAVEPSAEAVSTAGTVAVEPSAEAVSAAGTVSVEPAAEVKKKGSAGEGVLSGLVTIVAVIIAIGLFMVLPYYLSQLFKGVIENSILLSLVEGVIRIVIFIAYIKLISLMKDIKRVFMYHGAEHKCINCIESGLELNVENVRNSSREHRRCGTSFLLYVMVISIIFFSFIQTPVKALRVVLRIVLIPVIAGVSYEFIRKAGRSSSGIIKVLSAPGLWMQRLTTSEPDDEMIKVGIASVEAVFDWRDYLSKNFGTDEKDPSQPAK